MADTKISNLTALAGADVVTADDLVVVVDSNLTTTKKMTIAELIIALGSSMTTGDVKLTLKTSADTGWVMCDDGTIGSAASGATTRANADTEDLYTLLWNNVSDSYAAVSTGRGANAAADFAANKTIALTKMLGRALALSGTGATLTARSLGQTVGAETHQLTSAEMPSHTHTVTSATNTGGTGRLHQALAGSGEVAGNGGVANTGGGGAHNNMQPTSFLNAMIKL